MNPADRDTSAASHSRSRAGARNEAPGAQGTLPGAHIILVGLPGAGKSSAGRLLAQLLDRPFLDFDLEISRRTGMTIPELFGQKGEAEFRSWERRVTEELVGASASVLAPGGGWMTVPGLPELLRPPSTIVHLVLSPAAALRRLGPGVADRPLLRGDSPLAALTRLHAERNEVYRSADAEVNVEHNDLQQVIDILARLASPPGPA